MKIGALSEYSQLKNYKALPKICVEFICGLKIKRLEMDFLTSFNQVYVNINLAALRENIQYTYELCRKKSIDLAVVAKSICADKRIMDVIEESPANIIADSRLDNFCAVNTEKTRFLIRPSSVMEAQAAIMYSDISMQTSIETVKALEAAAESAGKVHDILIMIDLGDLRDGIYYTDRMTILNMGRYIHESSFLRLAGIAANYNCFSHLLPNDENMNTAVEIFHMLKPYYDTDFPIVSCGNSSAVTLLTGSNIDIPKEINQFRIGEAIVLGRDPSDNTLIPGYRYDTFILEAALIEVYDKPVNGRIMRRGVLSIGKQDLIIEHIIPIDEKVHILGACSDECVVDLSDVPEYQAGDFVKFHLEYDALMTLFSGRFFQKKYIDQ
ncbi:MAG: alanine racemase [Ruminococcus sp.]|nr:alanine racemase [Ruminococcus sp.]